MPSYSWNDVPAVAVSPLVTRQIISGQRLSLIRITLLHGGQVARHHHPHEQMSYLLSGSVEFDLGGDQHILTVGAVIHVPGDVPHGVRALTDSVVLEAFSPPRDDLLGAAP